MAGLERIDRRTWLARAGATVNTNATLTPANPQFTANMDQALASFKKMSEFGFDKAMFGHGDPIESGGADTFKGLAATLP